MLKNNEIKEIIKVINSLENRGIFLKETPKKTLISLMKVGLSLIKTDTFS